MNRFRLFMILQTGRAAYMARSALFLGALLILTACGGNKVEQDYPNKRGSDVESGNTIFGKGGFKLFGKKERKKEMQGGIGVNGHLWRASLDALSFIPLQSADPFGGVIITDWYGNPDMSDERFKIIVYILDKRLRTDGLRVSVFRQKRDNKIWVDAQIAQQTARQLENAILARARRLRIADIDSNQ